MNPPESGDTTGRSRFIEIKSEDFATVYAAVKYFNEMGEDADINRSLDLLEEAQRTLELYLSDAPSRTSSEPTE